MSTPMAVMDGMDGVVRPTAAGRMDGVGPALALSACAWAFCSSCAPELAWSGASMGPQALHSQTCGSHAGGCLKSVPGGGTYFKFGVFASRVFVWFW